jgi:hypothetical protein
MPMFYFNLNPIEDPSLEPVLASAEYRRPWRRYLDQRALLMASEQHSPQSIPLLMALIRKRENGLSF